MDIDVEKKIATKLLSTGAIKYMDDESMYDGIPVGVGRWEFEYVVPSIFQTKSYDLASKFSYSKSNMKGEQVVKDLYTVLLSMDKVFTLFQFERLNKFNFLKLYFEYFSIVARKYKLSSVPSLTVKAKFDGDNIDEFFFNIPSFKLNKDKILVINSHEYAFRDGNYYLEHPEGLHKVSESGFMKFILVCYLNSIVENINETLNISIDIVDSNEKELSEMIEQYKSVVDMMYT